MEPVVVVALFTVLIVIALAAIQAVVYLRQLASELRGNEIHDTAVFEQMNGLKLKVARLVDVVEKSSSGLEVFAASVSADLNAVITAVQKIPREIASNVAPPPPPPPAVKPEHDLTSSLWAKATEVGRKAREVSARNEELAAENAELRNQLRLARANAVAPAPPAEEIERPKPSDGSVDRRTTSFDDILRRAQPEPEEESL